jgi:hypothetical protein
MENARFVRRDQDFASLFRTGAVTLGCRGDGSDNSQAEERAKAFWFLFFKKETQISVAVAASRITAKPKSALKFFLPSLSKKCFRQAEQVFLNPKKFRKTSIKNEWPRPPSLAAARQFTLRHPSWVIYALSAAAKAAVTLRNRPAGLVFRNYLPSRHPSFPGLSTV